MQRPDERRIFALSSWFQKIAERAARCRRGKARLIGVEQRVGPKPEAERKDEDPESGKYHREEHRETAVAFGKPIDRGFRRSTAELNRRTRGVPLGKAFGG